MKTIGTNIITATAIFWAAVASAQPPGKELLNLKVVPPSPNAAALGKFGELPVGTYTGAPGISIPLWTEKAGTCTLPVSLSYHAGGVRLEEIAPSTGQGWALTAGGAVTRTVRGLPDDQPERGWLALPALPQDIFDLNNPVNAEQLNNGAYDSEADIFHFNVGGISGKFYLDKSGKVYQTPQTRIKIERVTGALDDPDSYGNIRQWRITNTDGMVYLFGEQEYTKTLFTGSGSFFPVKPCVSAWYLTAIYAPNGVKLAWFTYAASTLTYRQRSGEIKYNYAYTGAAMGNRMPDQTEGFTSIELRSKKLQTITTTTGTQVQCIYDGSGYRCDYMGDRALREVKVISSTGQVAKHYRLDYGYNGYAGTYTTCPLPADGSFASDETKRLTLQGIAVLDGGTGMADNGYTFTYTPMEADRSSRAQDHWGFYNGATNSTLVPGCYIPFTGMELSGADRSCNPAYSQQGALTKIDWPTGGFTAMEYENHVQGSATLYNMMAANTSLNGMEPQPWQMVNIVNDENKPMRFRFALQGFPPSFTDPGCWLKFTLTDATGATALATTTFTVSSGTGVQEVLLNLATGSYRIKWEAAPNGCPVTDPFSFLLSWNNRVGSQLAGGLRIKAIRQYDGLGGSIQKFYRYVKADGSSSGRLLTKPKYDHTATHNRVTADAGNEITTMLVRSATSNLPLAYTQGATVGYERVEELTDSNGLMGKTVYEYAIVPDADPVGHPYTPTGSNEWMRGQLTKQTVLQYSNGSYIPVSVTEHQYATETVLLDTPVLRCIKIGQVNFGAQGTNYQPPPNVLYHAQEYYPQTGRLYKTQTKQTVYDAAGNTQVQQQLFETDPQYYTVTKVTTWLNNAGTSTKEDVVRYPYQAALLPGVSSAALQALLAQNRADEPIEKATYKNGSLLTRQRTNYTQFAPGQWLPNTIQTAMYNDALQTKARINLYDSLGNVLEQQMENDQRHAYLYGYGSAYPIAEVTGAAYTAIAYTSFEPGAGGNWTFGGTPIANAAAPTGRLVYSLADGAITKPVQAGNNYMVSLWANGAVSIAGAQLFRTGQTIGGFTYREYTVSGTALVAISGSGLVDELRLYPQGAQMTSLTYDPLVGITTQSDASGAITRYSYDGLGRLRYIKDMNGRVVQAAAYGFKKGLTD